MLPVVTSWKRPKTQFTKIRCTYRSGAAVVLLRDYDKGGDAYINSTDLLGRQSLWADNVINELVKHITPPDGKTEVTDPRHKELYEAVRSYDASRDPVWLKGRLEHLKTDFSTHRKTLSKAIPTTIWMPKTADMITDLLSAYPRAS
jgi:hypothetical protein